MKSLLLVFYFIISGSLYSQTIEDRIYSATAVFNTQQTTEALATLNVEISAFEAELQSKDDYLAFVNLLINKAYYLEQNQSYQSAISTYEDAWSLYKKEKINTIFQYDIIENCLINLGVLYHKTNNYTNAENTIKYYIALAKKQNNTQQQAIGAVNLANLYQKLGKHTLAIEVANNGLKIAAPNSREYQRLKQIKANSSITLKGNKIAIGTSKNKASNIGFHFKNEQLAYTTAMQHKDYETALYLFKSLMHYWQNDLTSARELAKLKHEEAKLYTLLNQNEEAKNALQLGVSLLLPKYDKNSLPKTNHLYPENTFIEIFDALAALQDTPEMALQYYDLSFYVSNLLNAQITSQEANMVEIAANRIRSEKCIALLYQLESKSANTSYTTRAFQYAENSKASILKENHSKKELLKAHPSDTLLIEEQWLLKTQEQLTNRLIRTPYQRTQTENLSEVRDSLNSINIALRTAQKIIQTRYNFSVNDRINIPVLKQRLLVDDAALVAYFYGKENIYQFIFTDNTTTLNAINLNNKTKESLRGFITLFNDASVINNDVSDYRAQAFSVYKRLQLAPLQHNKNIVIIPDGLLNFIPFEALLTKHTETSNYSKMPFMVRQHTIVYNSSVYFFLKNKKHESGDHLLGVFPVFEGTTNALKYTINEAKSIEQEVDAKFLMYHSATKQSFLDYASQYNILHLSTHASSGDFIVPAHIEFSDETLYLNELYALNISPKLVVLSACETGIGKLTKGEGPMSLARGFNYAGAETILFSLWQISDASTAKIMELFYNDYGKTSSASHANHRSKIAYLEDKNISNIKKSPYYWSAFVFYGSIEPLRDNNINYGVITIISILFVVLLLRLFKQWYEKRSQRISS
ncbi:CHAT domain-containing protein [Bizionia gelidisalsuginis]|uniref:CHAT domain-containing protein n=1 Tax=Bizionia gelidisalsuginis TaxID=291188 RepID=A0ABY3M9G6_9FLAO|nr:CHAT domain-containing protein [Bizionia gelidisalsuginis]TYC11395.1 CHAT domain-containing protein [Bizionia gelidisalsuginis]